VAELFPSLRGAVAIAYSDPVKADLAKCDVVFFATPNTVAMGEARALVEAGVRVVDLSADFRIKNVAEWRSGTRSSTPRRSFSLRQCTVCRK